MAGKVSAAVALAAQLCRRFEGFYAKPYLCPANVPTIGFGSTFYPDGLRVTLQDPPITVEQAEAYLQHELAGIAPHVIRLCPVVINSPGKAAALISFAYNLGWPRLRASTLRRCVNRRDWPGARTELLRWVRGGGHILPGLVARRAAEAALI